ncbi:hypothetical protein [Streptomyces sp. TP-A0875]|uniref:hypothetical protein n=1 Tax=Streptomyces sp. TP-A0875 TaxID=552354 RepID=UPI0006B565B6|nr:hypothetical protein [Streptomyces sp. TP-A0875]
MPRESHALFAFVCLMLTVHEAAAGHWWWAVNVFTVFAGHVLAVAKEHARRKRAAAFAAAGREAASGFARAIQQAQQHAARKERP